MKELPERQLLILKEIVDRYIRLREPVSSRMILEDYGLEVSSATVRNDMNDLEEAGFIAKPYSSSGRVPTVKGYRFFVEWLLDLSELSREERVEIVEAYEMQRLDVEQTIRQTAFLLGNMTGCAGFVIPPRPAETKLERVVMFKVAHRLAFLLIVSDIGIVEHGYVSLDEDLNADDISRITTLINETLRGIHLADIRSLSLEDGPEGWYERPVRQAMLVLGRLLQHRMQRSIHFEGLLNLTETLIEVVPEEAMDHFSHLSFATQDENAFIEALAQARDGRVGLIASIGDFPLEGMESFSVISCEYRPHDGILGVVGPLWMDYGRALSTASYLANRLESLLSPSQLRSLEE
ncbi:heat-inducible transcriptional repressor HrcA [Candidatus Bipolaricaulota bacterium]|nr:heat-inducible transcriptional repressor HrcA [Candidatus Bipolaricaulota bacterium]